MRIDRVTWTSLGVALALTAVAVTVALARSGGGGAAVPVAGAVAVRESAPLARGAELWAAECAGCHARDEVAPAAAAQAVLPAGRTGLIDFLRDGTPDHPAFGHLDERDLAALADHLLAPAAGGEAER